MALEKLKELIALEQANATTAQTQIDALEADKKELTQIVEELKAENTDLGDRLAAVATHIEERITAINGVNLTPVVDGIAEVIEESGEVDTPEAIEENTDVLDTPDLTPVAVVEAVQEVLEASPEVVTEAAAE